MDYKTAGVLTLAIVSVTLISLGVMWFSPFQDSEVEGELSSTFTVKDVSIPINDIINVIIEEMDKNRGGNTFLKLVGDAEQSPLQPEHIDDLRFGEITSTFEIQLSGKNLEKLARGVMVSYLGSNPVPVSIPFTDDQISTLLSGVAIISTTLILAEFYFRREAKKESKS